MAALLKLERWAEQQTLGSPLSAKSIGEDPPHTHRWIGTRAPDDENILSMLYVWMEGGSWDCPLLCSHFLLAPE